MPQYKFPPPISLHVVVLFEGGEEVISVPFANIFYAQVIYHECEPYWSPIVAEEAGGVGYLALSMSLQSLLQELVG